MSKPNRHTKNFEIFPQKTPAKGKKRSLNAATDEGDEGEEAGQSNQPASMKNRRYWSPLEHQKFLTGMELFGKSDHIAIGGSTRAPIHIDLPSHSTSLPVRRNLSLCVSAQRIMLDRAQ